MSIADYIPAGRTSRIVRGAAEIQIQTEYAYRPNPRLTTTVFSKGQVLHKIEKDLAAPIASNEDKIRIEGLLRKQHMEVMEIINTRNFLSNLPPEKKPVENTQNPSLSRQLSEIQGVEKIYRLDNEGNFDSDSVSSEFKKKYSVIFKNLGELLEIFSHLPGGKREEGIYEVERNRLYLVSTGYECYFILARHVPADLNLEAELHTIFNI
jgi:hypothetical protein